MIVVVSQQCDCERNRIASVPWCKLESINSRSPYSTSQKIGDYLRSKTAASTPPTFLSLSITAMPDGTGHSYGSQAPCYTILSLGLSWAQKNPGDSNSNRNHASFCNRICLKAQIRKLKLQSYQRICFPYRKQPLNMGVNLKIKLRICI